MIIHFKITGSKEVGKDASMNAWNLRGGMMSQKAT